LASCGVDIGGTFTDAVLTDADGSAYSGKSPSTRGDLTKGFFAAIELAAGKTGRSLGEALAELPYLAHGTTVATNIMVQRNGARVGLLTTRGHGDAIFIQRAAGRVAGLAMEELLDLHAGVKPEPLVPRSLVFELDERVDADGDVVVSLDEDGVRAAVDAALDAGVDALAVAFLWSFRNPSHEQRVKELIAAAAPQAFSSISHEVAPSWGEYERTMTTVINSYVGPDTATYIEDLERELRERGFKGLFNVMKSSGGVASSQEAGRLPVTLLSSGPAGALAGSQRLLEQLGAGEENAITTDMGGTSFDIGLIVDGRPQTSDESVAARFQFHLPTIDINSIGSGGGSIAWIDEHSGTLKVGPRSAGAEPGPAAYGRGGTEPTVTDADIVLGYINPDYFLGGRLALRKDLAEEAVASVGAKLGLSTLETAAGIRTIVDAAMADAIRMMTISRGYDPRTFSLLAFGGAGPLHAADYARELGARRVIVPLADVSSLWSAMGVSLADVIDVQERHAMLSEPFDANAVSAAVKDLERIGTERLGAQDIRPEDVSLAITAKMKYKLQVNTVDVPVHDGSAEECVELIERFETRYRELFGAGSGYREAGIEITGFQCTALGRRDLVTRLPMPAHQNGSKPSEPQTRRVYWTDAAAELEATIYRHEHLAAGWSASGPAILELPDTTIALPPDYDAALDELGSIVLSRQSTAGGSDGH
ncbi:MAG: hydantoinase/oxoprolinase family protein, partial [Solirubrobacterales bacterium]|nr:hydantoinase/oxoprolinase family protein [Solirubrobacterales bacterium]